MKVELTADELVTIAEALRHGSGPQSDPWYDDDYRAQMGVLAVRLNELARRAEEMERINKIIGPFGSPQKGDV